LPEPCRADQRERRAPYSRRPCGGMRRRWRVSRTRGVIG
jgi:hypothetical protein